MRFLKRLIKKLYQDTRFSEKFIASIICLVIIPLAVLSVVFYLKFQQIIENEVSVSYEQVVSQYASQIENKFTLYRNLMDTIAVNGVVQDIFFRQNEIKTKDTIEISRRFSREIENQIFAKNTREIYSIMLYALNGEFPSDGLHTGNISQVRNEPWYPEMIAQAKTRQSFFYTIKALDLNLVSLARPIPDLVGSQFTRELGYVKVDLLAKNFFSLEGQDTNAAGYGIFLADHTGKLVYSENGAEFPMADQSDLPAILSQDSGRMTLKNANNRMLVYRRIAGSNLTVFMLFQNNELEAKIRDTGLFILLLVALILTVLTGLTILFSRVFTRRTDLLIEKINRIENGDLDVMAPINGNDEIGIIDTHFTRMVLRLNELISENYIQRIEKREAELKALQFQINPHFLYNTLESISSMAAVYDCREIGIISEKLGTMFRYSINKERSEFVTLSQEIQHIQNYFYIQKVRFGNSFTAIVEVPDRLLRCKVLRFILQPIIENSIIHGFSDRAGQGCIEVSAAVEDDNLAISIYDDGKGMAEEQVIKLNAYINEADNKAIDGSRESIGIKNVNTRIKLVCGSQYGLLIKSRLNVGTQVKIVMPLYDRDGGKSDA